MKIKYILPLMAFTVLAGCGYNQLAGSNFDTYIQNNGTPTSDYTMQNGNKLYFYKHLCPNKRNWEEYNIEVTPQNTVVKKTYVKYCPTTNNTTNQYQYQQQHNTYSNANSTESKLQALYQESNSNLEQVKQTFNEWSESQRTKGTNHPDTLALAQKLKDLNERSQQILKESNELRNQQ